MTSRATPRYLVPFHPKRVPHHFTDVLIIGGGLAGFRAAIEVRPELSALLVTKQGVEQSSSSYAQGGIASVLDPNDRLENHVADTLRAGGVLCDRDVVAMVVREGPERIRELVAWGTQFDQHAGALELGREGGRSHDRIVHALGDATGKEVMRAVIQRAYENANLETWPETFILDLLTYKGICRGALVWNPAHGKTLIWAKQTILCTGGAGQLYRETTNPAVATGDGIAIAYRAGAQLSDLEFVQFHPTMLYIAGSSRTLITEAMRGEGAYLVDRNGHRFMPDYDQRAELAPRDIVSQAIVAQMDVTRHPNVYLDLRHLDPTRVRMRFPGIAEVCAAFDLDITTDLIPVRPGAHYMVGGVTIDERGKTTLPGLWAAGEVSASGLHGANRLASNSLLEGVVFGAFAGKGASEAATMIPDDYQALPLKNPVCEQPEEPLDVKDIGNSLKSLMWRNVGIRRDRAGLEDAQRSVEQWCRYALPRQFGEQAGWELQNMLLVARLIIEAALAREESRGVHLRSDFPRTDDEHWLRHLTFQRG